MWCLVSTTLFCECNSECRYPYPKHFYCSVLFLAMFSLLLILFVCRTGNGRVFPPITYVNLFQYFPNSTPYSPPGRPFTYCRNDNYGECYSFHAIFQIVLWGLLAPVVFFPPSLYLQWWWAPLYPIMKTLKTCSLVLFCKGSKVYSVKVLA